MFTFEDFNSFNDKKIVHGVLSRRFDWVSFQQEILNQLLLNLSDIPPLEWESGRINRGWLTAHQYEERYVEENVTAIMLIATSDDADDFEEFLARIEEGENLYVKYHMDMILKDEKGVRHFYTTNLNNRDNNFTLHTPPTWVGSNMTELSYKEGGYLDGIIGVYDITHLLTTQIETPFLNWNENPLEVK